MPEKRLIIKDPSEWTSCPCCGMDMMSPFECPECFREVCADCIGGRGACRFCKRRVLT